MTRLYPLHTVGHSSLQLQEFISLLQRHGIQAIADVRSHPYSQRFPHFSKDALQSALLCVDIRYAFLGRELGARRDEQECYVGGQARYELIAQLPVFNNGIERVLSGADDYRIALMCAEQDPLTCHRTILVCHSLRRHDSDIRHILRDGSIERHGAAERRLMEEERENADQNDLFVCDALPSQALERAYTRRAERIAYRETESAHEALHDRIHAEIS